MPDFLKSRRGLAVSAAVIILCIMAFFTVTVPNWRGVLTKTPDTLASLPPKAEAPASSTAPVPAAPTAETSSPPSEPSPHDAGKQASIGPANEPASTNSSTPPAAVPSPRAAPEVADQSKPSFDIVRVEPTGESVIAARGPPNADVVLLDGDTPIATGKCDANGQVALLPPPLKPGEHSLMLSMTPPGGTASISSQSVAVSVPEKPQSAPMVALLEPNHPAAILSGPVAGAAPATTPEPSGRKSLKTHGSTTTTTETSVAISSVEVESLGSFFASGKAPPGSKSRIYLNGSFVATVTADPSGTWSLQIKRGMKPGRYSVRADQVETGSGKVAARAEVPFDYPAQVAKPTIRKGLAKKNTVVIASGGAAVDGAGSASGTTAQGGAGPTVSASSTGAKIPSGPSAASPGAANPSGSSNDARSKSAPAPNLNQTATAAQVASNAPSGSLTQDDASSSASSAPTVVAELVTAKVVHGDSLWRISRQMLGHGVRYTQIYAANTTQIRDPRLIYPGQIFVMPQD